MRIKITLLLLILSLSQQISAQVPTVTYPERKVSQNGIFQIAQINTFRITPPDVGELLKQDLQQSSNMENPFALLNLSRLLLIPSIMETGLQVETGHIGHLR